MPNLLRAALQASFPGSPNHIGLGAIVNICRSPSLSGGFGIDSMKSEMGRHGFGEVPSGISKYVVSRTHLGGPFADLSETRR